VLPRNYILMHDCLVQVFVNRCVVDLICDSDNEPLSSCVYTASNHLAPQATYMYIRSRIGRGAIAGFIVGLKTALTARWTIRQVTGLYPAGPTSDATCAVDLNRSFLIVCDRRSLWVERIAINIHIYDGAQPAFRMPIKPRYLRQLCLYGLFVGVGGNLLNIKVKEKSCRSA
jgi:hypothetical protein